MFRGVLPVVLLLVSLGLCGQDLQTAQNFFNAKDYSNAKTAIDKVVNGAGSANTAAWLLKHKICYGLGTGNNAAAYPDVLLEGFRALRKCAELPGGEELLIKEIGADPTPTFYNYYEAFINNGSAFLNKENYPLAYNSFVSALGVSDYFYQEKITQSPIDTMIVFYAGYSAMKNNDQAKAEQHFLKLASNNCSGADLQIAYGWLANYYLENKKLNEAIAVCEKGLKIYPADEYLRAQQLGINREGGKTDAIFKSYEDLIRSGKAGWSDYLSYGAELYDYLFVDSKVNAADKPGLQKKLEEVMNKALELKPGSAAGNYIMGMYFTEKARTNSSGNRQAMLADAEKSAFYLEKAAALYSQMPGLPAGDKDHLKSAIQQLVNLYKYLGKPEQQAKAEQKLSALK